MLASEDSPKFQNDILNGSKTNNYKQLDRSYEDIISADQILNHKNEVDDEIIRKANKAQKVWEF